MRSALPLRFSARPALRCCPAHSRFHNPGLSHAGAETATVPLAVQGFMNSAPFLSVRPEKNGALPRTYRAGPRRLTPLRRGISTG